MSHDQWLTVGDVVRLLGVHEDTVRRWLRSGRLKGRNFGGRTGYRIRRADRAMRRTVRREHERCAHCRLRNLVVRSRLA